MTMQLFDVRDADPAVLNTHGVAVIGYGNQGHAHALNLRDSGVRVIVGQRSGGAGYARAISDGFKPVPIDQAVQSAGLLILSLPDEAASTIYAEQIAPHLRPGQTVGFVHGFNIRFGLIDPPAGVDCVMVAPKGPGTLVRSLYVEGRGLPALGAIERNPSGGARATLLAWAAGIGSTRAAVIETTFAAETEADLFGEQVVLCGGVTALMKAAFETLVAAGIEPELAYIECIHELKQIVDLVYLQGISAMRKRISRTAAYGDVSRGPRVISDPVRNEMQRILDEVQSGDFAREWIEEHRSGSKRFAALLESDATHPMEEAGRAVRALMPWLTEARPKPGPTR